MRLQRSFFGACLLAAVISPVASVQADELSRFLHKAGEDLNRESKKIIKQAEIDLKNGAQAVQEGAKHLEGEIKKEEAKVIQKVENYKRDTMPSGYEETLPRLGDVESNKQEVNGWVVFPTLQSVELVKWVSNSGKMEMVLDPAVNLIQDPALHAQIENGAFDQLILRSLYVYPAAATPTFCQFTSMHAGADCQGTTIPFLVRLVHRQDMIAQGTILVSGLLQLEVNPVEADSIKIRVFVGGFRDSQSIEENGRLISGPKGAFARINLDFAKKVVEPVLTEHFNNSPRAPEALVRLSTFAPAPVIESPVLEQQSH